MGKWEDSHIPEGFSYVDGFEYVIKAANGHGVATLCNKGDSATNRKQAKLLAAAPSLAEALAGLLTCTHETTPIHRAIAFRALMTAGVDPRRLQNN